MRFTETRLKGAFMIDPEPIEDERGFLARSFCRREFEARGLNPNLVQCTISVNHRRGTLRGMHYQAAPYQEAKLVRCARGRIYDLIIDLRRQSETFRQWVAVELTASNRRMIYVPEGFAHGYQTLEDDTEIFYQISEYYRPELARGVRWNDPAFAATWPIADKIVSPRDQSFPNFVS